MINFIKNISKIISMIQMKISMIQIIIEDLLKCIKNYSIKIAIIKFWKTKNKFLLIKIQLKTY